jgi:hypothetical protein
LDIIEGASYDANPAELGDLGLPEDIIKMVAKHFTDLKEITKDLNHAVEDKKLPEKMRGEAKSEAERKDVNKAILEITKALTTMRNNKIEWHSKMKMDVIEESKRFSVRTILLDAERKRKNATELRPESSGQSK